MASACANCKPSSPEAFADGKINRDTLREALGVDYRIITGQTVGWWRQTCRKMYRRERCSFPDEKSEKSHPVQNP